MKPEIIVLLCLLALVSGVAWMTYDASVNSPSAVNMRCIAIDNKQKQGLGLTYQELKFKREHCDLY